MQIPQYANDSMTQRIFGFRFWPTAYIVAMAFYIALYDYIALYYVAGAHKVNRWQT